MQIEITNMCMILKPIFHGNRVRILRRSFISEVRNKSCFVRSGSAKLMQIRMMPIFYVFLRKVSGDRPLLTDQLFRKI